MKLLIQNGLPWILSTLTICMTWLAGNKYRYTWALGLLNQALWLVWILVTHTWGLLPMNIALWCIYLRNHFHWRRV